MKKFAWLAGFAALAATGVYTVLSLNRWEWNRALFFGLTFVVTEVAIASALILRRLAGLTDGAGAGSRAGRVDPSVLARLEQTRPHPQRFRWLEPGRTHVFITMVVGGGVIISGLAWLVDQIAARTTTPAGEASLARDLGRIAYPRGGLLVDDVTVLAQAVPYMDDPQLRTLLRRAGRGR